MTSRRSADSPLTGTLARLRPYLEEALAALPAEELEAVIAELPHELETTTPPEPAVPQRWLERARGEADTWYAIHNDDLKLLGEASTVAVAVLGAVQSPAGVVAGLVVLLYRYRRKRIRLDGEQGIVLRALKQAPPGGWGVEELALHLPPGLEMGHAAIGARLETLKALTRADGSPTALVAERDGRWWAVDV